MYDSLHFSFLQGTLRRAWTFDANWYGMNVKQILNRIILKLYISSLLKMNVALDLTFVDKVVVSTFQMDIGVNAIQAIVKGK